jgi:hypothetical protein
MNIHFGISLISFWLMMSCSMRRDSSVGIATGYGLFDSRLAQNFPLHQSVQTGSGAHTAFYLMGNGGLILGVKRLGREVDHTLHLLPRSRMVEIYLHSPLCLHLAQGQLYCLPEFLVSSARIFRCLYRYTTLIITNFDIFTAVTVQIVILRIVTSWNV